MLRTGKMVWEAHAKKGALELRKEELEFHVQRYTILVTQCSVLAALSFGSAAHMRFPEEENWLNDLSFMTTMLALTFAMMFSLYVVVCGSCLTVFAYQLGLLGTDGQSLEDAVLHLRSRRISLFLAAFACLICLVIAGIALTWVKLGALAPIVTAAFCVFTYMTGRTVVRIFFAIGDARLVSGKANLITKDGWFDMAALEPSGTKESVFSRYELQHPEKPL